MDRSGKIFHSPRRRLHQPLRKIAADAWHVNAGSAIINNAGSAIIDGEVVVPAADGTTDLSVLQNELKGRSKDMVLVAFADFS